MSRSRAEQPKNALRINELIKLQVRAGDRVKSYPCRVEDLQHGQLFITLPDEAPELTGKVDGLMVRLVKHTERGLLILNAQVAAKLLTPVPLLVLKTEGSWERVQRRWDVRLQVTIDPLEAVLMEEEQQVPVEVTILDISAGGLLLRSRRPMAPWSKLHIKFELPGFPPPLETEAEVTRDVTVQDGPLECHRIGVRFVNLHERDKNRIIRFIFQEQVRRRKLWQES